MGAGQKRSEAHCFSLTLQKVNWVAFEIKVAEKLREYRYFFHFTHHP
jgi:hypothetical protein